MGVAGLQVLDQVLDRPLGKALKDQFLNEMAKNHEEWQVRQADYALRLYDFFLSRNGKEPPAGSSNREEEWARVEEEACKALRLRQRSLATEKTYLSWLRQFRGFTATKLPQDLDGIDLQNFLTHLAVERRVAAATQNQALNAVIFVYRHVLEKDFENVLDAVRAKHRRRLPLVLTASEVEQIFHRMSGLHRLMAMLIYGGGLRLVECLRLRIKDLDLEQGMVMVRSGKGDEDRRTVLPERLRDELIGHLDSVRALYDEDREKNLNGVALPGALERKYPRAGKEVGLVLALSLQEPFRRSSDPHGEAASYPSRLAAASLQGGGGQGGGCQARLDPHAQTQLRHPSLGEGI